MRALGRKEDGHFFAVVICTAAVDGSLLMALRSVEPAVVQVGSGDFAMVLTQHGDKLRRLKELLILAGLEQTRDFLLFEEWDHGLLMAPKWGLG